MGLFKSSSSERKLSMIVGGIYFVQKKSLSGLQERLVMFYIFQFF
jgi:hypothetical protein